jgi:hypothetical protein
MLLFVFLAWLTAAPPAATPPPPSDDLHVVVGSEFVYMARTRPLRQDWWLGEKRRAVAADGRLTITREDLGVVWRIDTKAGTYTETPRPAPGAAPDGPPPFDIHTAGYTWEPEFDWSVRETGREATIAGRPCREFGADGQADYSDTTATFWGCTPLSPGLPSPTEVVTAQLRNASTIRMIREWAARQGLWVLQVEESTEPAIAPTLVMRVKVEVLESAPAPAGTFELSPSLKKAGR